MKLYTINVECMNENIMLCAFYADDFLTVQGAPARKFVMADVQFGSWNKVF